MRHGNSAARTVLFVAMILCGTRFAGAAEKWISVQSPNFLLVGNASESRIRRLANDLEQLRAVFAMRFPGAGQQSSATTTVVVFKDDLAFRPFKPLYESKPSNISGYFQSGSDVNIMALKRPHTMTVASGRCTSEPRPVERDAGNRPSIATNDRH